MRAASLIIFVLVLGGDSFAQPGGVPGAVLWNAMDTTGGVMGLRSLLPGNTTNFHFDQGNNVTGYLNFRPGLVFPGDNRLRIELGNQTLAAATIFTVYHCTDTARESGIWYTTGNDTTQLVLTTDRMADIHAYKYMNFVDVVRSHPKVNIYTQQTIADSTRTIVNRWYLGTRPVSPTLPIYSFKGLIPEIVVYNRALSGQERLQVASYLALKYGITQTEPNATYLNSGGEVIWNGLHYASYHNNIAGLGRDDSSGFAQWIACSANTPGLFTLSTAPTFADRNFLLWGDNGQTLTPDRPVAGLPMILKKKWLMIAHTTRPDTTDLRIDTRQIDAPLPIHPVYWLAIDPTGKGNFTLPGTVFTRMSSLDPQGQAYFEKVVWNTAGAGKDVCAIIPGQNLLLAAGIDSPNCAGTATGSLNIRILGGDPPYRLTVMNNTGVLRQFSLAENDQAVSVPDLAAGKYRLYVSDAGRETYTDSFYINNSDGPGVQEMAQTYTLPVNGALSIELRAGLTYDWTGPDNFQSAGPQVRITQPGVYTLACSKAGCTSLQDITVINTPKNALDNVLLYPNPSTGAYSVRVGLPAPASVNMSVYTMDGKLIYSAQGSGRSNYLFSGILETAGQYEIYLTSGSAVSVKQLLIAK
jgi:hypothetical protein